MRKTLLILALVMAAALPALAELGDAERVELEAIRDEAVRARAFIRAAETQLSKVIDRIDAALSAPELEDPVEQADDGVADENEPGLGFTALAKSADTRVIYVSHSGGDDANDGLSEETPVKTLARGVALLRDGRPDWLLLKAGDTWTGQTLTIDKGGASEDEPLVVWSYGEGSRPTIVPAHGEHGVNTTDQTIEGLVLRGLRIYGATRDPGSPAFVGRPGEVVGINARINAQAGRYIKRLLIEDVVVTHFDDNILVVDDWARNQGEGVAGRVRATIRRNVVRFASATDAHSVGIYLEGTRDSIVEENLIDHNGWAQTDGVEQRDKASHNIYAQRFNGPITVRRNLITRAACAGLQLRAGGTIERNLFVRNATAFWASINDSKALYNVVLEGEDMDPAVAADHRGMGIEGWAMNRYEVVGNLVARRVGSLERPGIDVSAGELIVKDNTVYRWADDRAGESIKTGGEADSAGNITADRERGAALFADPERGVDDYAKTLGLDPTLGAFLDQAAAREAGTWPEALSAEAVSAYIRAGFEPAEQAAVYESPIVALAAVGGPARRVVGAAVDETAEGYVAVRQAGVTVDGGGATIRGWPVNVLADGVTIRNLRVDVGEDAIRAGGLKAVGADGLLVKDARAVTIEHVTARGATDECIEVYGSAATAVRHCLIADPIIGGLHPKGAHGLGCNVVGVEGAWVGEPVTIERNLFVRCDGRHPSVYPAGNAEDYADSSVHVRIVNNVIYHPGRFVSRLGSREPELQGKGEAVIDFAGNVVITSDKTDLDFLKKCVQIAPWETLYQRDNTIILPDGSAHDLFEWAGVGDKPFRAEPNYPLGKGYLSDPRAIVRAVCEKAGATPADRHAQDRAIVNEVTRAVDGWAF
jgi:hypothetical protein